jgi:hypothetical protein
MAESWSMHWEGAMQKAFYFGVAVALTSAPAAPAVALPHQGVGTPISNSYRAQFGSCDRTDKFGTVQFPIRRADGRVRWYGCRTDPSRFDRFDAVPAAGAAPSAVILEAKLAHDRDGSPSACGGAAGPTDQCATSLMLNPTAAHPCVIHTASARQCVPVNAEEIPYAVIPVAAPPGIDGGEFRRRSGVGLGDYGVVIANGRVVPVIVADGGPAYKIGEGSTALLHALASAGHPTIASGVTYILFPGSRDPLASLSPDTLAAHVRQKGGALYAAFKAAHP